MKRFLLSSLAAVALVSTAAAADLTVPDMEPIMPVAAPAVWDWTGIYGGVHVGWGWAERDATNFGDPFEYDLEGPLVGGQVGGNFQFGNFVLGVEGDLSLTNMEDDVDADAFIIAVNVDASTQWMATLRGRAGFAFNRFMIYGTGGLAAAEVDTDVDLSFLGGLFSSSDSASETYVGWTVGGGVEGMVTEHVSLGLEYLYADFGEADYDYEFFGELLDVSEETELTSHLVRGKLNVRF